MSNNRVPTNKGNETPFSPLSPLRLSNATFEARPKETITVGDSKKHKRSRSSKATSGKLEAIELKGPTKDGFEFDFSFDHLDVPESEVSKDKNQTKKAGELTSILLDTRNNLRADCNIIDPIKNHNTEQNSYYNPVAGNNIPKISRGTLLRAEKVKSLTGLKYLYIQRTYESALFNEGINQHPGIEGVYNPLQIIRNRKIRAKYQEYPKPLSLKTLPLASNVFSSKNKDSKRPWKMVWAVELSELLSDTAWRNLHWHELKKSNGELWFPADSNSLIGTHKLKEKKAKSRFYDKLFNEVESDTTSKRRYDNRYSSTTTMISSSSDDSGSHIFRISRPIKSPSRKKNKEKAKKHTRKFYDASSSSSSDEEICDEINVAENNNLLNEQFFKRISGSPEEKPNPTDNLVISPIQGEPLSAINPPPIIKIEDTTDELDINNISIKPMENRWDGDIKQTVEHSENVDGKVIDNEDDKDDKELLIIDSNFHYLEGALKIKINYLLNVYPRLVTTINSRIDEIIRKQLHEIFQLSVRINDDHLPSYEQLYVGLLNEIKSVVHLINDDYSIRIDNLLSNSDRSIGEINTSLSLELRKVNERLDNLNSSLFSNIVTETLRDNDLTMNLKDGNNYKILYCCLENLIVILLRLIWIFVNCYKCVLYVLKFIWKVIKTLLF